MYIIFKVIIFVIFLIVDFGVIYFEVVGVFVDFCVGFIGFYYVCRYGGGKF